MKTRRLRGLRGLRHGAEKLGLSSPHFAELLEQRLLLSAYSIKTLATLSGVNAQTFLPEALVVDNAGNLYGTASAGGASNNGYIFELPQGQSAPVTLADFGTTVSGSDGGLLIDSGGNLYGSGFSDQHPNGLIWEIPKGGSLTVLASFNGTGASSPEGSLAIDASGNIFGAAEAGGANSQGAVFEVVKGSGTVSVLASFNHTQGTQPFTGVTLDGQGNVYGTTSSGGANGTGTVYILPHGSGTITPLVSFDANTYVGNEGVVSDANGNLFGVIAANGTSLGTVYEIPAESGAITNLVTFDGTNGAGPQGEGGHLVIDASGNLFGTLITGAGSSSPAICEIVKGSNKATILANFDPTNDVIPIGSLTQDRAGNLYGLTFNSSSITTGTIYKVVPSNTTTIDTSFGQQGTVTLNFTAVANTQDAAGNLLVAGYATDSSTGKTQAELDQLSADGSQVTKLIQSPAGTNDQFNGVQIDDQGQLVLNGVASDGSMFLARYSATGTPDATFGTGGKIALNTTAAVVQAVVAADGTVYTVGESGGQVQAGHFDSNGNAAGGFGSGGSATVSQLAPQDAQGVRSEGISIQSDGKIIIVGQTADKDFGIVRLNANGSPDATFGNSGLVTADFGGNDGADRVSVDPTTGNIVVFGATDANGGQIAVAAYDSNGLPLASFGDNGLKLLPVPSTARLWDNSGLGIVVGSGSVRGSNILVGTGKKHTASTTTTTTASTLQRIILGAAGSSSSLGTFGRTGKKNVPLTFTLNGVKTTIAINVGTGTATQNGNNIDLEITSGSGVLTIKTTGGRASIGNVTVTGGLKSITAITSDLVGTFNVSGALAKATVGGISGVFRVGGAIGSLTASALSGTVSSGAGIGKVKLGSFTGTLAAASSIASVLAASMTGAKLLAGGNLGADGVLGSGDDSFGAGSITALNITGAMGTSVLAAGVDPVDGVYGNGDDTSAGAGKIKSLFVKGGVDSGSRFEAQSFASARLPGKVDPKSDPRFVVV